MKHVNKFTQYVLITFCISAVFLISYIFLTYPQPGVADQGDFDRVMNAVGLKLTDDNETNPYFVRFFNYIVTDYKIPDLGVLRILQGAAYTSIALIISIATFISRLLGQHILKTEYLAAIYCILYTFSLFIIIKYLNIKSKPLLILLTLLILFVFYDGNYLIWFNSLYGEPMMITSLLLYIASWLYYIYHINVLKSDKGVFLKILLTFIAAFLLLGAKAQTITTLPIILILQGKLLWKNRQLLSTLKLSASILLLFILIAYPLNISMINKDGTSKDTQYNSVFFGVLKNSENPAQDLIDMGLNPDMAVEARKNSYLDKSDYVKYIPHSRITEEEFYSHISNGKLIKFYVTHPLRLIKGMEYTAEKAFFTGTFLGKHKESYSAKPINDFHRFTLWSDLRSKYLPKKLIFIVLAYTASFSVSLYVYLTNNNKEIASKIQLFWALLFISILQYPMPFIGNGEGDTSKQLFLFNFIFDIQIIVSFCWIFHKLFRLSRH